MLLQVTGYVDQILCAGQSLARIDVAACLGILAAERVSDVLSDVRLIVQGKPHSVTCTCLIIKQHRQGKPVVVNHLNKPTIV